MKRMNAWLINGCEIVCKRMAETMRQGDGEKNCLAWLHIRWVILNCRGRFTIVILIKRNNNKNNVRTRNANALHHTNVYVNE